MIEQWLSITLESDVALTASSATIGGLDSLRYIPGSALLGAAAARLYTELPPDDAFRVFHSNDVRFGCGLPSLGSERALPWPASFVTAKRQLFLGEPTSTLAPSVVNLAVGTRPSQVVRNKSRHFLLSDGRALLPEVNESTRTAIGDEGRARDGFLFTTQALAAPSTFLAPIRAKRQDDLDRVVHALKGIHRLGRSRSAEFGRTRIELVSSAPSPFPASLHASTSFSVLLASDVALRDDRGLPTVDLDAFPHPDGWSVARDRTFAETRNYTPFNGKRGRPDTSRTVLAQGSVITLVHRTAQPPAALADYYAAGVGWHRNEGLGEVVVAPAILGVVTPADATKKRAEVSAPPTSIGRPEDELSHWLEMRAAEAIALDKVLAKARHAEQTLLRARISPAQWGQVRTLATRAMRTKSSSTFAADLNKLVTSGVGSLGTRWGLAFAKGTLGSTLVELVKGLPESERPAFAVHLATRMLRVHRKKKAEEEELP